MHVQVLSKFSVPCQGHVQPTTLHAIVPDRASAALQRLQRDDPIWNSKEVTLNWEWRHLPDQSRLRVRDRIKFWLG